MIGSARCTARALRAFQNDLAYRARIGHIAENHLPGKRLNDHIAVPENLLDSTLCNFHRPHSLERRFRARFVDYHQALVADHAPVGHQIGIIAPVHHQQRHPGRKCHPARQDERPPWQSIHCQTGSPECRPAEQEEREKHPECQPGPVRHT